MQLSRYAPNDMDTDEKKQEYFLNGLDDGFAYALEACDFENFQTMIGKALVLKNKRGILSSKHRQERQTQQSTNSRPRINISSSPTRPIFHPVAQSFQLLPQPSGQGFFTPQRQMILCPNLFQTLNTGNQSAQGTQPLRMQHRIKQTPVASTVDRRVIKLTVASVDVSHPPQLQECLHRQTAMEALPRPKHNRTMLKEERTKWLWRKLRMPQPWCLIHLSSILFHLNRSLLSFLLCSLESWGEIPVEGVVLSPLQIFKFWNVTKIC
jgi:hypothetical protein